MLATKYGICRVLAVLGVCLVCSVWAPAAGWAVAPPVPTPAPSAGGELSSWVCTHSDTPSKVADKTQCAATAWATNPPVAPVVVPAPVVTVAPVVVPAPVVTVAPGAPGAVLTEDQWLYVSLALGLIVFLSAAAVVGSWKS